ncbi:MAG: hypothetical protein QOG91_570, partial [Candidatus Parcubacteria bacterium]|nr:hypothetical protein [Candidatus Parcubacteria bacterium]
KKGYEPIIHRQAYAAYGVLTRTIDTSRAKDVLIIGHDILLQAIAGLFLNSLELFSYRILTECEGFALKIYRDGPIEFMNIFS